MPVLCGKRGPVICQFCVGRGNLHVLFASSVWEEGTCYIPVLGKREPVICQFCVGRGDLL